MLLYGMSSPNVRKVVIALEEMRLKYDLRRVRVFLGEQFDADFLDLNPMAKVPVLCDPQGPAGDVPIFESGTILLYLAETHGPAFLPTGGAARYDVLRWLFLQVASMGPALGNHSHFRGIADANAYAAARFRRMAAQVYRALDRRLEQAPFLGGESYSVADMAAYPWAIYFRRHGMRDAECPHLVGWASRIGNRPAVRAADAIIARLAADDARDRAAATPEQIAMFLGEHLAAPDAAAAASLKRNAPRE